MDGAGARNFSHWCFWWGPLRATSRARGARSWAPRAHPNAATGAFGGAPQGPRIARGACRSRCRGRMRMRPLGHSAELPEGHGTREGRAGLGAADARERGQWGIRWSSLRATQRVRGVPNRAQRAPANAANGAFGGAPYVATKRVRVRRNRCRGCMRTRTLGHSVGHPMWPRAARGMCRHGCRGRMRTLPMGHSAELTKGHG
eukprot:2952741-Pyramimonas_sp.AAC.1